MMFLILSSASCLLCTSFNSISLLILLNWYIFSSIILVKGAGTTSLSVRPFFSSCCSKYSVFNFFTLFIASLIGEEVLLFFSAVCIATSNPFYNNVFSAMRADHLIHDYIKACDRIHPEYLCKVLKRFGLPDKFIKCIHDLFFGNSIPFNVVE